MAKKVLILSDGKLGHQNQSVRLAEVLDVEYDIVTLERRKYGKIFSLISPLYIIKNARALREQVKSGNYSAIIGLGTAPRLAMVGLKSNNANLKTICLADPKKYYNKYDVVVSPNHDNVKYSGDNLIKITGALSYFRDGDLDNALTEFKDEFTPLLNKPLVGLIVGGDSRGYNFTMLKAQELLNKTFTLAQKLDSKIYATTSRRTAEQQASYIKYRLEDSGNIAYTLKGANPFRAIMGYSSIIVVTPETVSMLMESCSTNALVLVYDRQSVKSARIRSFVQELIDKKLCFDLEDVIQNDNIEQLIDQAQQKTKFKELEKVADFIKSKKIL